MTSLVLIKLLLAEIKMLDDEESQNEIIGQLKRQYQVKIPNFVFSNTKRFAEKSSEKIECQKV